MSGYEWTHFGNASVPTFEMSQMDHESAGLLGMLPEESMSV